MKSIITSKNCFYRDLRSLCEEIGKKCVNGEKMNLDKEVWHVLNNGKQNKITFELSYSKPSPLHTNILLTLFFDEWRLKTKHIVIEAHHSQKAYEDGYELPIVEYSIDNMFYSTIYLNGEYRTSKEKFF